jgi:hypothetical protein
MPARSIACGPASGPATRWTTCWTRPPCPRGGARSCQGAGRNDHHRAAFLLTLGVLIVVHEYGHYRVAVACGVKVLRFSVGFGRVLWRRQRTPDATEFVVCALPLGGYVRMLDEREAPVPAARTRRPSTASRWAPHGHRGRRPAGQPAAGGAAVCGAHWIGVVEPKAVMVHPGRHQPERPPACGGDWVRAIGPLTARTGPTCVGDRPALADHAGRMLQQRPAPAGDRPQGRGSAHTLSLDAGQAGAARGRRHFARKLGLGRLTANRCWAKSRRRPGGRGRAAARATACWPSTVDGRSADARRCANAS